MFILFCIASFKTPYIVLSSTKLDYSIQITIDSVDGDVCKNHNWSGCMKQCSKQFTCAFKYGRIKHHCVRLSVCPTLIFVTDEVTLISSDACIRDYILFIKFSTNEPAHTEY